MVLNICLAEEAIDCPHEGTHEEKFSIKSELHRQTRLDLMFYVFISANRKFDLSALSHRWDFLLFTQVQKERQICLNKYCSTKYPWLALDLKCTGTKMIKRSSLLAPGLYQKPKKEKKRTFRNIWFQDASLKCGYWSRKNAPVDMWAIYSTARKDVLSYSNAFWSPFSHFITVGGVIGDAKSELQIPYAKTVLHPNHCESW